MLQVYVGVPLEVYIFYDDMYIYIYIIRMIMIIMISICIYI